MNTGAMNKVDENGKPRLAVCLDDLKRVTGFLRENQQAIKDRLDAFSNFPPSKEDVKGSVFTEDGIGQFEHQIQELMNINRELEVINAHLSKTF